MPFHANVSAAETVSDSAMRSRTAAPHRSNAAYRSRSDSPYQQRTTQRDNPTQQLIKQAVDFLLQQLEAGKSETLTSYLAAMARFHSYSFGNILAIARQRPTATRVAGFSTWKELGRFVKKGEKGIQILAPMMGYRRKRDAADQSISQDEVKPQTVLIGFRAVYVFDVVQTEGADLPEFEHSISGDVGGHRDRLIAFLAAQNIALEYTENIAPALGVSYGGKIAILPGQSNAEEFVTLVHEVSHELLHKTDRRTKTTATVRETEAEAIAFIVGQGIGLEMGRASSDYIQMYAGNAVLLAESLEVIQRTSAVILDANQAASKGRQSPDCRLIPPRGACTRCRLRNIGGSEMISMEIIEEKAEKILHEADAYRAPVPIQLVAQHLNLELEALPLRDISGMLIVRGDRGAIGYDSAHARVRQRFTICHEIAHFALHAEHNEKPRLFIDQHIVHRTGEKASAKAECQQVEANRFGAALLMPKDLVQKEIRHRDLDLDDDEAIKFLAKQFWVSPMAIANRLLRLGIFLYPVGR